MSQTLRAILASEWPNHPQFFEPPVVIQDLSELLPRRALEFSRLCLNSMIIEGVDFDRLLTVDRPSMSRVFCRHHFRFSPFFMGPLEYVIQPLRDIILDPDGWGHLCWSMELAWGDPDGDTGVCRTSVWTSSTAATWEAPFDLMQANDEFLVTGPMVLSDPDPLLLSPGPTFVVPTGAGT